MCTEPPPQSGLEKAIMALEELKDAAFAANDFDECARLRAEQMELLGQAGAFRDDAEDEGGGPVLQYDLDEALATNMEGATSDLASLAAERQGVEADLIASNLARGEALRQRGAARTDSRTETLRAVAELEEMKQRLLGGRTLEECGILDDETHIGRSAWGADSQQQLAKPKAAGKDALQPEPAGEGQGGGEGEVDMVSMMAEMAQLNAEMDAELAALSSKVQFAKAQREELQGSHGALLQQFEETKAFVESKAG
jgi:hypothetical protein